jgi:ribonucleoside-triphosphate reductase
MTYRFQETTDMTLFVRTSGEETAQWNRQRIIDALIRETNTDLDTAEVISREVEKEIFASGIAVLTTSLIRELVDAKLIEKGHEKARRLHTRLGFPLYDVRQLIRHQNKENANVPHGPEGTNLLFAEGIKREYALLDVFSQNITDAHISGDIHLHGLGYIDRPYSSCQTVEYIKKFGLRLPHSLTVAKPARHAEVLLAHMVRFGTILQGCFAGVIGWDAVNWSFAPYMEGLSDRQITQLAQLMVYEFSQLMSARGGQIMFSDIHLYWTVPPHLNGKMIIGPGGDPCGSFNDHVREAQRFAMALLEVFRAGDGVGRPFVFPRPILHLCEDVFHAQNHGEWLNVACRLAAEKGNPCFVFDRSETLWMMGSGAVRSLSAFEEPWNMRHVTLQNVSINLPRIGYRAKGDDKKLQILIEEGMHLAAEAHAEKRRFLEELLALGDQGPLSVLTMKQDGLPYLCLERTASLIGMVGLNELVHIHKGQPMHASEEALAFGLAIVEAMARQADRMSRQYGSSFLLFQTPAESTAYRFARLDLKHFSPLPGRFVKGNLARGEVYYTNSTHLGADADLTPGSRVEIEGRFHPFLKADAMTYLWLGDKGLSEAELAEILTHAFHATQNREVIFSPEFTTCLSCNSTTKGLAEACTLCGSKNVEGIARIAQYFSRISGWNQGKLAELRDRRHIPTHNSKSRN